MLKRFLQSPSLETTLRRLAENQGNCKVLAGGTDVLVDLGSGKISPETIVDLSKLTELTKIELSSKSGDNLRIGSMVTMNDLVNSAEICEYFPALAQAAKEVGSLQIRNRATIGGNIINASPGADVLAALSVFDTKVILRSHYATREFPLGEFTKGPGETMIERQELLTEIVIKLPPDNMKMRFTKITRRNASSVSLLNITCALQLKDDSIGEARIAVGAILPVAKRLIAVETFLLNKIPSEELFREAGQLAREAVLKEVEEEKLGDKELLYDYKLDILPGLVQKILKETIESEGQVWKR